ncbi:MAG TPA: radical SAM protein, partial [Methanomicrobiales archaeon]|nr:radical SAM protein [Methanomicrobiales archaeon]
MVGVVRKETDCWMNPAAEADPVLTAGGLHPDYREEMEYFYENKVYSLQIETTLACPQECLYCYASPPPLAARELPAETIRTLLRAAAGMEIRAIDWLGGDPLLRDDWYELMAYARNLGMKNSIWSSGMPFQDLSVAEKAVEVSRGGFISVHLDTLDAGIYRVLHGGDPESKIRSILEGVDHLLACGKRPEEMINCITFTRPLGDGDAERTIRFFFEEKGMRTCITPLVMAGGALAHPEWRAGISAVKEAFKARDRINYPGSLISMHAMDVSRFYCGGMLCVTVDGDVTPCSVIREGFGNVHTRSLETILDRHKADLLFLPLREAG